MVRLLHHGEEPVVVHACITGGRVRINSRSRSAVGAAWGIDRIRFALSLDHDLAPFRRRFRFDPLIGPEIRRRPWLRWRRTPLPFEALAWAITEQLIETERAFAIQRRLVYRYGRSLDEDLRDSPTPKCLASRSAPELEACDLAHTRALALIRCAREVERGRVDLSEHESAWARLERIPEIGPWTLERLAVHGQGRDDQLPAGDLAFVRLVGHLGGLGRRATVEEVREFFEPYGEFAALAGLYALGAQPRMTPRAQARRF
ncbi:MAG: DNA-3-methyladenine glycosylase 2 family protein [Thermoleophilaceae bacterium]|nr:DNA-3-methyladenine glycosylase 2 family protein [Thermoleophilaceae bacterium]